MSLQVVVCAQHDIEAERAEERAGVVGDVSCVDALASLRRVRAIRQKAPTAHGLPGAG